MMSDRPSGLNLGFHIEELYSHVADNPFVVAFVSVKSTPDTWTADTPQTGHFEFDDPGHAELLFIVQMFCTKTNDDGFSVTQYLGACVTDISQCSKKTYHFAMRDASSRPPLHVGQVSVAFTQLPRLNMKPHRIQSPQIARQMYSAAEANLHWIQGFGPKGLPPIVHGLHWVHSPYYVNYMGISLPSGAFCMLSSRCENTRQAIRSYKQRLMVALARNTMKATDFVSTVADMMSKNIKSVPREPSIDGNTSFTGDCEDYAREIYQHCKEIREWVTPKLNASPLESAAVLLQLYVPTIEQGAVDSNAHSKYVTYNAPYRNHIWAALHPRDAWRSKCTADIPTESAYVKWPLQACEKTLPVIHLEGTGEVYPVVTSRKPGFIAKMQRKQQQVLTQYPNIACADTPDISLQCDHKSTFYKYAIACMTDAFADAGVLDYTYVSDNKYGVSIYNWARGKYKFRPSCTHSQDTMATIRSIIAIERPIPPIVTKSKVEKMHRIIDGYSVRYGQKVPFDYIPKEAEYAIYDIGGEKWHEVYFLVGGGVGSASSTEIEGPGLFLV